MILQTLETERLVLHPLKLSDAGEMVAVLAEESLYEFETGAPPSLAGLRARYEHQLAGSPEPGEIWLNWIIRKSADGRAVGFVQADLADGSAEIGWLVGTADQGCGIATEAANAVMGWLASHDVRRFEAHIHVANDASLAVARRLGLSDTGIVDGDAELIWAATVPRT